MTFNARIVQGDDVDLVITVRQKSDDAVIDLTGVTALTFKAKNPSRSQTFIDLSLGAGVVLTDASNGVVTVTLTDDDTSEANLPAGEYVMELEIIDSDSPANTSTVRDFNDKLGCLTVLADLDNC